MENRFEQFRKSIDRKITGVKAEVKHLSDNVQTLATSIDDLGDEFGDFAAYVSEMYSEHDARISALEKAMGKS